jgi:hypothetical protein
MNLQSVQRQIEPTGWIPDDSTRVFPHAQKNSHQSMRSAVAQSLPIAVAHGGSANDDDTFPRHGLWPDAVASQYAAAEAALLRNALHHYHHHPVESLSNNDQNRWTLFPPLTLHDLRMGSTHPSDLLHRIASLNTAAARDVSANDPIMTTSLALEQYHRHALRQQLNLPQCADWTTRAAHPIRTDHASSLLTAAHPRRSPEQPLQLLELLLLQPAAESSFARTNAMAAAAATIPVGQWSQCHTDGADGNP